MAHVKFLKTVAVVGGEYNTAGKTVDNFDDTLATTLAKQGHVEILDSAPATKGKAAKADATTTTAPAADVGTTPAATA